MTVNTQTIELDISKEGSGVCVKVGQGDAGGTTIRALMYDNGAELSLADASVFLVALLPNRRNYYRASCNVSGNAATVTVDESKLCSVAGYTDEAYFTIEKDGSVFSTERFALEIIRSALDGQKPAESWDAAIDKLIKDGNTAVQRASGAAERAETAAENASSASESAQGAATAASNAANSATRAAGKADVAAESASTAAQSATEADQAAREAEAKRKASETKRAIAETERELAQQKNNADQALNNEAMKKLSPVILNEGQYDPDTLAPMIEGEANRMYLVPMSKAVAATLGISERAVESGNSYAEWMWISDKWEMIGEATVKYKSISTDQIDSVFANESPTGDEALTLTGLSYVWAKILAWAKAAFAPLAHKHSASDVTSGTLASSRLPTVPVAKGGTGATTAAGALAALGAASAADLAKVRDSVSRTEDKLIYSADAGQFVKLSRCGKLVVAVWSFRFSGITTWSTPIPDGWRPKNNTYGGAILVNDAGIALHNTCAGAIVYAGGKFTFHSAANVPNSWHEGSMFWFVE